MELKITAKDENQLNTRIEELGKLYKLGLTNTLFWEIVHNLHNGVSSITRRNVFDISEWVEFYGSYDIAIEEDLLQSLFEYLTNYYGHILSKENQDVFRQQLPNNIKLEDSPFGLETIILKSMEIIN